MLGKAAILTNMAYIKNATWVSHSSISDFLKCHRAYYLKNVYKDPRTNRKMTISNPSLALGTVVHEVLDCLYKKGVDERFNGDLMEVFEECWSKVSGKKGGFTSLEEEEGFKIRGREMVKKVIENPGPLKNMAVKINLKNSLNSVMPAYFLSEEENIILCGKVDWLEYNEDGSVNIFDFKTGKHEEEPDSLQLPIYSLLTNMGQKRVVKKICYWYLDGEGKVVEMVVPNFNESKEKILHVAKEIKRAREGKQYDCLRGGCFYCRDFERILAGEGEQVGVDNMNRDIYILLKQEIPTPEGSSEVDGNLPVSV